jgi:hypothetical protein
MEENFTKKRGRIRKKFIPDPVPGVKKGAGSGIRNTGQLIGRKVSNSSGWCLLVLEMLKPLGHPLTMLLTGSFIKEVLTIQDITSFEATIHLIKRGLVEILVQRKYTHGLFPVYLLEL